MQTPVEFFAAHAGLGIFPGESEDAARTRGAHALAAAERAASDAGCSFEWSIDPDTDSSDWSEDEPYEVWQCIMRDGSGAVVASLGGVDFGPGGEPWGEQYRRVVEAELASEWLSAQKVQA